MTENTELEAVPMEEENKGGGRGLSWLALLLAVAALGGGGYLYQEKVTLNAQGRAHDSEIKRLSKALVASEDRAQELINANKSAINSNKKALDKALQTVEELGASKPGESEVKAAIAEALANYAGGQLPKVDLSKEISQWESIRDENKAISAAIKEEQQQSAEAAKALDKTIASAKEDISALFAEEKAKLDASVKAHSNPAPLINALTMADIAAQNGNYPSAVNYLNEAIAAFERYNLNKAPYEQFKELVYQFLAVHKELAAQPSPAQQINELLAGVDQWPFQTVKSESLVPEKSVAEAEGFWNKTVAIGNNLIASTVTVHKNDDRALAWINKQPNLQNIIRQNVRLDLAFARNALQIGDYANYQEIVKTLSAEIGKYFQTDDENVAAALKTLNALQKGPEKLPKIGELVQAIEQAK